MIDGVFVTAVSDRVADVSPLADAVSDNEPRDAGSIQAIGPKPMHDTATQFAVMNSVLADSPVDGVTVTRVFGVDRDHCGVVVVVLRYDVQVYGAAVDDITGPGRRKDESLEVARVGYCAVVVVGRDEL